MRRLLNTLHLENGELYATISDNRILLANCEPLVEIYEDTYNIKSIGVQGYNVKIRHITLVLCDDMAFTRKVDFW